MSKSHYSPLVKLFIAVIAVMGKVVNGSAASNEVETGYSGFKSLAANDDTRVFTNSGAPRSLTNPQFEDIQQCQNLALLTPQILGHDWQAKYMAEKSNKPAAPSANVKKLDKSTEEASKTLAHHTPDSKVHGETKARTANKTPQEKLDQDLLYATRTGKVTLMKDLLIRGANIHAKNKDGNTALHLASAAQKTEVIKFLFEFVGNTKEALWAILSAKNKEGNTPVHLAINTKHLQTQNMVLSTAGVVLEALFPPLMSIQNNAGNTVLHSAVFLKDDATLSRLLIQMENAFLSSLSITKSRPLGVVIGIKNNDGDTAGHAAIAIKNVSALRAIIKDVQRGGLTVTNEDTTTKNVRTERIAKDEAVARTFATAQDNGGLTVWDRAKNSGNKEIMSLFPEELQVSSQEQLPKKQSEPTASGHGKKILKDRTESAKNTFRNYM